MHGNVAEWVDDDKDIKLEMHPPKTLCTLDRKTSDELKCTIRGGGWDSKAKWLRSAARLRLAKSDKRRWLGFRVATDDLGKNHN